MKKQLTYPVILSVLLIGCATDINLKNAKRYSDSGHNAVVSEDWDAARRAYAKAAVNSDLGNAPVRTRSIMYYEYARASGATCFYDIADEYLKKSLELDKSSNGPIYWPLIELARLNLDQGKYAEALIYFDEVDPIFTELKAIEKDPIGYADYLDEYATALEGTGSQAKAAELRKQANTIRDRNLDIKSFTDRTPYGKHCVQQ